MTELIHHRLVPSAGHASGWSEKSFESGLIALIRFWRRGGVGRKGPKERSLRVLRRL